MAGVRTGNRGKLAANNFIPYPLTLRTRLSTQRLLLQRMCFSMQFLELRQR